MRAAFQGQPLDIPQELPFEYANLPIEDALKFARANAEDARRQEHAASLALSQRRQLGESLGMLRKDLRDASKAFIEKSGDAATCPVCGTSHVPTELLAKIEALVTSETASQSDGLRHNVQVASERLERERRAIDNLTGLDNFRRTSGAPPTATSTILREELVQKNEQLIALTKEIQGLEAATAALGLLGVDWVQYAPARDAAVALLPVDADPSNPTAIAETLESLRNHLERSVKADARFIAAY